LLVSKDGVTLTPEEAQIAGAKAFGEYFTNALARTPFKNPTAFARAAKVSPAAVSRWVNGQQRPTPRLLARIAPLVPREDGEGHVDARDLVAIAYPEGVPDGSVPAQLAPMHRLATRLNRYLSPDGPLSTAQRDELERSADRLLNSFDAEIRRSA
jgi:transcriptional regulator with XRE-family HTH domain